MQATSLFTPRKKQLQNCNSLTFYSIAETLQLETSPEMQIRHILTEHSEPVLQDNSCIQGTFWGTFFSRRAV